MNFYYLCTTNEAFEDQLTKNKTYKAKERGACSILIEDDKGVERWYGLQKFVIDDESTEAMAHG